MTSIFRRALGADFDRLHPQIQRRFSVGLDSGQACIGRGTMTKVWHGGPHVRPFLALGATRNILLSRRGADIPFVIENVPYQDSFGRETVTFARTFDFAGHRQRFDATMIYSERRGCIVDYLGTHQHLASDLHLTPEPDGSLLIRSGAHRFREGRIDVRVPDIIGGDAEVRETYDERAGCFRIRVRVTNRYFGLLFGYQGTFHATYTPVDACGVRSDLQPVREEVRA